MQKKKINKSSKYIDFQASKNDFKRIQSEFNNFLIKISVILKQNKPLRHLFLKDGTPIYSLSDIPDSENILFASRSPFFKGFRRVMSNQSGRSPSSLLKSHSATDLYQKGKMNSKKLLLKLKTYKNMPKEQKIVFYSNLNLFRSTKTLKN